MSSLIPPRLCVETDCSVLNQAFEKICERAMSLVVFGFVFEQVKVFLLVIRLHDAISFMLETFAGRGSPVTIVPRWMRLTAAVKRLR